MEKVTIKSLIPDLEKISQRMSEDGLDVGLIAHVSSVTMPVGEFFAERFGSEILEVPSPGRQGRNRFLTYLINAAYPHMPESALRFFAERHKRLHERAHYYCDPNFDISPFYEALGKGGILLVDDNAYTGKTLELWKEKLEEVSNVITFSIAVTGEYRPDYYCRKGWHSFDWRPVGI